MKHVWILNHYAQEPGRPGGTRHYSLARHLPQYGWHASIIAAGTELNTGRQRLRPAESRRLDIYDGVPFLWLRDTPYEGNGMARLRNMLGYTRAVLKPENLDGLQRPDAIIGSSVHPFAAWAGRRLAKRLDVPFLFEVRDLWPQTLIDMGRLSARSPITYALRGLEKSLYRSAEKIIVLLPKANAYIQPLGIPSDNIIWIPNGVEIGQPPPDALPARHAGFTLMYFGAHGGANGLDNVIRAMRIVQDNPRGRNITLRLIGDGPSKPALMSLANEIGASAVHFEKPVPKKHIPELAAEADSFVFNLIDAPVFKYGISSNKLFDFMAARRPTIFCCDSVNNPIAEANGGITVPPSNPAALAKAMIEMAHLPEDQRVTMGSAARRHVEQNYDFERLSGKLAEALDRSLDGR